MKDMDTSEIAKYTGVPASTLRFYEEKGLITSIGRRGLKRLFDPSVLDKLSLIALGRTAGFSLDEIASIFSDNSDLTINRQTLLDKADEIDVKIKKLTAMQKGLRHAASCQAPSHMECSTFKRLMRAALSGRIQPPKKPV